MQARSARPPKTRQPGKAPPGRRYAGQSAAARRTERRERLLSAGFDLFGTEGYASTTIARVCDHAGLIPRYFYESFESREALLTAIFDRIVREAEAAVGAALEAAPDDRVERLRRGVGAFLHAYLDDPRCARIVCMEVGGVSPSLERLRHAEIRRFASLIEAEAAREVLAGRLLDGDHHLRCIALAGAVNTLIIEWLTLDDPPPIGDLEDEIVRHYLASVEGDARAAALLEAQPGSIR